jgi:hypothetical protein
MKVQNMSEPLTAGAGAAALKFFGATVLASAAATALGFLFLWPKTLREAFVRFACAIFCSFTLGPALAFAARAQWPGMFASAQDLGQLYGDPQAGVLIAAAPFLVFAALPAWWLFGWFYRWIDRRRDKDLGEIFDEGLDAAKKIKEVM